MFRDSTGRSLNPENLHSLCEKAFNTSFPFPAPNDLTITRTQFCKDKLPDRTFTFWEWFYAAMKLTRRHFNRPWNDGNIIRFISKAQAESHLVNHYPGTFLLRFTDCELGSISIAWVHKLYEDRSEILHLQPLTAKDLDIRSLSDRIGDIDNFSYLFPNNTPKHEVFDSSKVPDQTPRNKSYVASRIRAVLDLEQQSDEEHSEHTDAGQ
ncbi:signal transducer and transcription activator-like [Anopheles cruzii]|nr:signal transducer and transcription activator-like [Anopheles cruzii]